MNKHQKLVQAQFLGAEDVVISRLNRIYRKSYRDITGKIAELDASIGQLSAAAASITPDGIGDLAAAVLGKKAAVMTPAEASETIASMLQSKIYQKDYQKALQKQVDSVLDKMSVEQYTTISDYLQQCYEDGYCGTMYDLHGQGIPLILPMDQEAMVMAVQLDSKISAGLYAHLGEDVKRLKNKITAQVSRGISSGMTYEQVAQQISASMMGAYNNPGGSLAYAMRIARTEGHRVQVQSAMNACHDAKDMGADVVKQWDSTLDGNTRPSHRKVDGEIRELDEPFSNGLMYPGDPNGGAGEVIHCRCALLQRARWALDADELDTLQERAKFFGLDKKDSFDEFKQKYLQAAASPAVKPKKEYLTKQKLEQLVQDGTAQLDDLKQKFKQHSGGWEFDEIIADFGSLEDFTDGYDLKVLKALKQQIDDVEGSVAEWAEKLKKKVLAAETKKLKKVQVDLQDQLDQYPVKTYSGIWKDDVTTKDWPAKQAAIPKKKAYFEQQLMYATDPQDIAKWKGLLDDLDDFDKGGSGYFDIKKKLDKAMLDLKNLQAGATISPKGTDDAFSQARKDAALWFDKDHGGFHAADSYFDPPSKAIHGSATSQEQDGFYTYTAGSGGHNRPLAGFQKPWSMSGSGWEERFYVGPKKVWIDFEGKGDQIRGLTTLIQKSTYDQDLWLQSGQNFATIEGFLQIPYGSLSSMTDSELQQFVGRRNVMYSFISTAVNEGGGSMFNGRPLKINFYAPKGTQMLYASDVGAFGKGENEMILQRGGTYEITKIYWGRDATDGNSRKIFVDMEIHPEVGYDLFQQDPNEWTGSRKNYHN